LLEVDQALKYRGKELFDTQLPPCARSRSLLYRPFLILSFPPLRTGSKTPCVDDGQDGERLRTSFLFLDSGSLFVVSFLSSGSRLLSFPFQRGASLSGPQVGVGEPRNWSTARRRSFPFRVVFPFFLAVTTPLLSQDSFFSFPSAFFSVR